MRQASSSRNDFQAEANRVNVFTPGGSKQQADLPHTSMTCTSASYPTPEDKSKGQDDEGQDAGNMATVCAWRRHRVTRPQ